MPTSSVSNATTNSWSSSPNEYVVWLSTPGYSRPTWMCPCMIRQRSCAGSPYHSRDLTNGYTNTYCPRTRAGWCARLRSTPSSCASPGTSTGCPPTSSARSGPSRRAARGCARGSPPRRSAAARRRRACPRARTPAADVRRRSPRTPPAARACPARGGAESRRRQAGSSFRNVYLTKCRLATARLSQPAGGVSLGVTAGRDLSDGATGVGKASRAR